MTRHELKIAPAWFDAVRNGIKKAEVRLDDRHFAVGDTLHLEEFYADEYARDVEEERPTLEPREISNICEDDYYTGREVDVKVTHILGHEDFPDGIAYGYVVLSIEVVE